MSNKVLLQRDLIAEDGYSLYYMNMKGSTNLETWTSNVLYYNKVGAFRNSIDMTAWKDYNVLYLFVSYVDATHVNTTTEVVTCDATNVYLVRYNPYGGVADMEGVTLTGLSI